MSDTLVVTGASGKLGALVLDHLRAIHDGPIVATSRDPSRVALRSGVEARRGDFEDPASLDAAFAGGDRLLIISTDAVGGDGRRQAQHRAAIAAAARAGVRHVVYTSLTRPEPGALISIAPDHFDTEQALAASGMGWTALRDNLYADLLPEFLAGALHTGELVSAAGEGGVGWVTREDCARTAAAVLHDPPADSGPLDVTGPALISYREAAGIASRVLGREIAYRPASPEQVAEGLARAKLPPHVIQLLVSFQEAAARGDLAVLSDTVRRFTGRDPMAVEPLLAARLAPSPAPA